MYYSLNIPNAFLLLHQQRQYSWYLECFPLLPWFIKVSFLFQDAVSGTPCLWSQKCSFVPSYMCALSISLDWQFLNRRNVIYILNSQILYCFKFQIRKYYPLKLQLKLNVKSFICRRNMSDATYPKRAMYCHEATVSFQLQQSRVWEEETRLTS